MSSTLFKAGLLLWLNHPHVNRISSFCRSSFRGIFLLSLLKRKWDHLTQTILADHSPRVGSVGCWVIPDECNRNILIAKKGGNSAKEIFLLVSLWLPMLPCVWQKVYKGDREWCRPEPQGRLPRISRAKLASGSLSVSQASKIAWCWHNVWKMTEGNGGREPDRWVTGPYKVRNIN